MAASKEAPAPAMTGTGAEMQDYEKLRGNFITADESLAILRRAQCLMLGISRAVDRMQASIAKVSR